MSEDPARYGKSSAKKRQLPSCDLVAALRANGGPLALAAADRIEQLEGNTSAPAAPTKIHPLHLRLILIFQTRVNKPVRDPAEVRAWQKVAAHVTSADVEALEQFYSARQSAKPDETWSRKTAVIHLIRALLNQIELAYTWRDKRKPRQAHAAHQAEPTGWQQHAIGALGERSWRYVCEQYPDEAQRLRNLLTK